MTRTTESLASSMEQPADPAFVASLAVQQLENAFAEGIESVLALFSSGERYWRDALVFDWTPQTHDQNSLAGFLSEKVAPARPRGFEIDPAATPPRWVRRADIDAVEAIIRFDTDDRHARGVVRVVPEEGGFRLWNVFTSLESVDGMTEHAGPDRPKGYADSRKFGGPNWLDRRIEAQKYADRDPEVLVIGGGQAGLSIAARLGAFGVDTLVVDRYERPGDNWRYRYHALTLHNSVWMNDMPYLPYPTTWPVFVPKDLLADWMESYVKLLSINFWGGTTFLGGHYDEEKRAWTVEVERDGERRTLAPKHVIMATGISGAPRTPQYPGLEDFSGEWLHSSDYREGRAYQGKKAIVFGSGNSGHDVAQDLYSAGASEVSLVQRGSTTIVSVEPGAVLNDALYHEGNRVEDSDLVANSLPYPVLLRQRQLLTAQARELDAELLAGLEGIGFKLDFGDDDSGHEMKYMRRGGGYYMNVGASDLLIEGKIRLVQDDDIDRIVTDGVRLRDGSVLEADLLVFAFGFLPHSDTVRRMFGDDIADKVGEVWGYDEESGEVRNVWTRTAQDGLWFMAGNFLQCRYNSKLLAFQIKAALEGREASTPQRMIPSEA